MLDLVIVEQFAHDAHDSIGHKRKYTGLPYWVHLDEVATIVRNLIPFNPEMVAAAYLHDVIEDVFPMNNLYNLDLIRKRFGINVARMVSELTDEYTFEKYPQLNRATRKSMETARLATISPDAQTIKLADSISNSADILKNDPNFAKIYLKEKAAMLEVMTKGNQELFNRAKEFLKNI